MSRLVMPMRKVPWDRFLDDLSAKNYRECPVCGGPWRPWHGSYLPCHAVCLVPPALQDELLDEQCVTVGEQAARLGVNEGTVRAAIAQARKRRRGGAR